MREMGTIQIENLGLLGLHTDFRHWTDELHILEGCRCPAWFHHGIIRQRQIWDIRERVVREIQTLEGAIREEGEDNMNLLRASAYQRPRVVCGCAVTKTQEGFHEITHCYLHGSAVILASALAEMYAHAESHCQDCDRTSHGRAKGLLDSLITNSDKKAKITLEQVMREEERHAENDHHTDS